MSFTEVKYRVLATTTYELKWIHYLLITIHYFLINFGVEISLPIKLFCVSQSAFRITANPIFHEQMKHLDIDYHIIRNEFESRFILFIKKNSGTQQVVDFFT